MGEHLWECNHAYYCNEGNFHATGCGSEHKTFVDFLASEGQSDMDYNLLFRWDWIERNGDDEPTYTGDDYYRNGRLLLFFMGQRKGAYRWVEVQVCRADEESVKAYLAPRFQHLMGLWQPLATPISANEESE